MTFLDTGIVVGGFIRSSRIRRLRLGVRRLRRRFEIHAHFVYAFY
jgi:hypothetical protein